MNERHTQYDKTVKREKLKGHRSDPTPEWEEIDFTETQALDDHKLYTTNHNTG